MSDRVTRSGGPTPGLSSLALGRGGRGGNRHARGGGRGGGRAPGSTIPTAIQALALDEVPDELTKVDFLKLAKDFPSFSGALDTQASPLYVDIARI